MLEEGMLFKKWVIFKVFFFFTTLKHPKSTHEILNFTNIVWHFLILKKDAHRKDSDISLQVPLFNIVGFSVLEFWGFSCWTYSGVHFKYVGSLNFFFFDIYSSLKKKAYYVRNLENPKKNKKER